MKKWMTFCGENYYPSGGINDLFGVHDTVNEMLNDLATRKRIRYDWLHVYDTFNGKKYQMPRNVGYDVIKQWADMLDVVFEENK
jgi:hypothetical protein